MHEVAGALQPLLQDRCSSRKLKSAQPLDRSKPYVYLMPPAPSPRTAARSAVWISASVVRSTLAVASSSARMRASCSSALRGSRKQARQCRAPIGFRACSRRAPCCGRLGSAVPAGGAAGIPAKLHCQQHGALVPARKIFTAPGEAEQLALADGQVVARLGHAGVQAAARRDGARELRRRQRRAQPRLRVHAAGVQVAAQRAAEQDRVLQGR